MLLQLLSKDAKYVLTIAALCALLAGAGKVILVQRDEINAKPRVEIKLGEKKAKAAAASSAKVKGAFTVNEKIRILPDGTKEIERSKHQDASSSIASSSSSSTSSLEAERKEEPARPASRRPLLGLYAAGSRDPAGRAQLEHVRAELNLLEHVGISAGYRLPNGGAVFLEAGGRFNPPF